MKFTDLLKEAGAAPIYYFAYGMLTDPEIMPGATLVGAAELKNFVFEMFVYANVLPAPGARVIGSLWEIDRELLSQLDQTEGYPSLYDRKSVPVFCKGRRYEAEIYTMTPSTREHMQGSEPSEHYIRRLERGYENAGIPLRQLDDALDVVYQDLDEGWKDWAATGALAAGMALGGGAADAKSVPHAPHKPAAVQQVKAAPSKVAQTKAVPTSNVETYGVSMNTGPEHTLQRAALRAGIKGPELAQFMAQTRHESADFTRMKEIGGAKYFAKRYDPQTAPGTAKILGNTHAGDGVKYHGRGFIQITGRDNYRMAGQALGLPLEQKPELAANPEVAAKIAVWYWNTRVRPNVQNFNDTAAVTKYINPALRGLQDRLHNFKEYKIAMNMR
jgi:predicted chitinase/gamma-glutamylcyclotransferase (GGCT)/AIG2-like uncharacterized protein YtfP